MFRTTIHATILREEDDDDDDGDDIDDEGRISWMNASFD